MSKPGNRRIDRTGHRYGRLEVLRFHEVKKKPSGQKHITWWCRCDCGKERAVSSGYLKQAKIPSCGCSKKEAITKANSKHGMTNTTTFRSWAQMRRRCYNKNDKKYKYYGGRGIEICKRWETFEGFYQDMGERPEGLTLDRISVDGNYEPSNCRWASMTEQVRNRRKFKNTSSKYKGVILAKTKSGERRPKGVVNSLSGTISLGGSESEEVVALRFDKVRETQGYYEGTNHDLGLTKHKLDEKYPCDFWYHIQIDPKVPKPIKLVGEIANA